MHNTHIPGPAPMTVAAYDLIELAAEAASVLGMVGLTELEGRLVGGMRALEDAVTQDDVLISLDPVELVR